uniref:Uncharacterized protein n=1 Tax=viral metagenome TaxID=1070528 RepID=A0A6M3KD83_9ZZZZ
MRKENTNGICETLINKEDKYDMVLAEIYVSCVVVGFGVRADSSGRCLVYQSEVVKMTFFPPSESPWF